VYVRQLGGQTLEFGHRGWLVDDAFTFYDRDTDSVWLQTTGECIWGPRKGKRLARLPCVQTKWRVWRRLHPHTKVLAKPEGQLRYKVDSYARYHARRGSKFGLAVFVGSKQKLYPLSVLVDRPLLVDRVGGKQVLIVCHPPSGTAVAYGTEPPGAAAVFDLVRVTAADVLIRHRPSRSTWSGLTGRLLSGEGERPQQQPGAADQTGRGSRPRTAGLRQSDVGRQLRLPKLVSLTTTHFDQRNWRRHFPSGPIYEGR